MIKKRKRINRYVFRNNIFDTFKAMKTFAYFNIKVGEKDTGFKVYNDEIINIYDFTKQERRLLCRTIYDYEKINLEKWNNRQTKLFNDG